MFSFFTRSNTEVAVRRPAATTRTRLCVEILDARDVPAVFTWQPVDQSTNWNAAKNWVDENKANAVPGAKDTVVFAAASNADVTIPDGIEISGVQIEAMYSKTLTLEGDLKVLVSVSQKGGEIKGGVFTFTGSEYLWTGGARVGTGEQSNTEVFTVIGWHSNLLLPSTTTIAIEGATVQVKGTASYNNDQPGAGAADKGKVSLGKTGRFVVDGIYDARVVKQGDGELIFEDDKKFGESQVVIDGRVIVQEGKVSVNADFNLKSGCVVEVGLGQTEPCRFYVGGASVSSGSYYIGKTSAVLFYPNKERTDNPVSQFNGTFGVVTSYGKGRFSIAGEGLVKINGWVAHYSETFTTEIKPRFVSMNAQGDMMETSADTKCDFPNGIDLATEWVNRGSAVLGPNGTTHIRERGKISNVGTVTWASGEISLTYENNANGVVVIENRKGATFLIGAHVNVIRKANAEQQGIAIFLNEGTLETDPANKSKYNLNGIHYKDAKGAKCKQNGSEFDWGNGNPPKVIKGNYALGDGGKVNFGESLTIDTTGVLTGNGTVVASQVFNLGTIAPGEDVAYGAWDGSLPAQHMTIVGDLMIGSPAVVRLGWRNGQGVTTVDTLTILGDLVFSGRQAVLELVGEPAALSASETYTLFTYTGSRYGWFGTIAGIPTGWAFYYDPQTGALRTAPPGGGGGNPVEAP